MARLEVPTKKLTYEEFLEWCDEDTWAEWVDGEVIVLSPASKRHQELADFLTRVLGIFVEARDLGVMVSVPFQMKTGPDLPGREPDLLFVTKERLDLLKGTYLDGPADLVVEITSAESRLRDRGTKFGEYEIGGALEYWLLDLEERRADFFLLGPEGRYERQKIYEQGIYKSRVVPGFWLKVEWLWQEPLPPVLEVLRELELI